MYQATVDNDYIIELGACLSMFSELQVQFNEASILISEYEKDMDVVLISEAEGSAGIVEKKKGFFKKVVDIMKSIWKGLCNILRRIMQLLAKPFYLLFGVREKKKVDIPTEEGTKEEGFVRNFKRVGGLTEGLSQVFEMKEMGDTGIEELFHVDKMYQTLINIAEDGEILEEIKKESVNSIETIRRKKEMIDDSILDEEGSVDKESFVRISEKHKDVMKNILEFSNIMKKMITTEVIDFNTTNIKTAEEVEAELVDSLEKISNSHLGNKFSKYINDKTSKYIHALRDFANDKSDIVTDMKLTVDNVSLSGRESLYYAQIEIIASLLESSTVSDDAIHKLEEVITSPMASYDKSFTTKLSEKLNILKSELSKVNDEVSLMKAIGVAKDLVEVISSNNNRKEAFTMTRQGKSIHMDKKDIFKALDYTIVVETLPLQKLTGALNAMFTSIDTDTIGKKLNLFNDEFIKDVSNKFKNEYLKPISALSESISDDMSKVNILSGDNTPLKSASGNTRPTKEKQLKAARFNSKEDSAKLNAIVAEATRNILSGMKEDVTAIMNQVIDMEKHIRLSRISRINAAMTMYISYFANLLLAENEYILAMKEIEKNSNDDVIKSMYFDAVRLRKSQYTKFKI